MAETKDVSIIVSTLLTLLQEKKYPTIKEILETMNGGGDIRGNGVRQAGIVNTGILGQRAS